MMGVQQLEDTFSTGRTNSRAWFSTLGLGTNDVSVEQRISPCDVSRGTTVITKRIDGTTIVRKFKLQIPRWIKRDTG